MPNLKVLLVDPFYNPSIVPPHWSLGIIENKLNSAGVATKILDFVVDKTCEGKDLVYFIKQEDLFIASVVEEAQHYDCVYITTSYGIPLKQKPVFPRVIKICEKIKLNLPKIKIVVGGSTVNYANRMLGISSFCNVDHGLVDKYVFGDEIEFVKYFFTAEKILTGNLYEDEVIKWKGWDFSKYPKFLSLLTARGCVFNCSFCFESKIFERIYETIPINIVLNNIKIGISEWNINKYAIEDSTFLTNPKFETFCDEIIKNKIQIQWSAYARINQILRYKNLLPKLRKAGCTSLITGIESSNDKTLKGVNKNITSSETVKAIRLLKKESIGVQGCFVLGFPGETYEDINRTIDFGLGLDLFAYRWHVYQPNLSDKTQQYIGEIKPGPYDYLRIQANIPDSCIPEMLKSSESPITLLTEEHFLVRAIPYLDEEMDILKKYGYNGLIFSEIFKILKSKLNGKSKTFNEEVMYDLI